MPKYLLKVSYEAEGLQGVLKEGGSARREAAEKLAADLGGSIESFYFAFGDTDAFVIAELPSTEAAAALAMTVSASGRVSCNTVPLITPEEIDGAAGITIGYRPPGG